MGRLELAGTERPAGLLLLAGFERRGVEYVERLERSVDRIGRRALQLDRAKRLAGGVDDIGPKARHDEAAVGPEAMHLVRQSVVGKRVEPESCQIFEFGFERERVGVYVRRRRLLGIGSLRQLGEIRTVFLFGELHAASRSQIGDLDRFGLQRRVRQAHHELALFRFPLQFGRCQLALAGFQRFLGRDPLLLDDASIATLHRQRRNGFISTVEEGEHLIVFGLRDLIVLVIVALRAAEREPEPDGTNGVGPIEDGVDAILFLIDAPFFVRQRLAN